MTSVLYTAPHSPADSCRLLQTPPDSCRLLQTPAMSRKVTSRSLQESGESVESGRLRHTPADSCGLHQTPADSGYKMMAGPGIEPRTYWLRITMTINHYTKPLYIFTIDIIIYTLIKLFLIIKKSCSRWATFYLSIFLYKNKMLRARDVQNISSPLW